MVIKEEITSYSILLVSNWNQLAYIYLYNGNRYLGYYGIFKDGTSLPTNVQHSNGILNLFFHQAEMNTIIDTLRNEQPAYVSFNKNLKWAAVGTDKEPVGEAETP